MKVYVVTMDGYIWGGYTNKEVALTKARGFFTPETSTSGEEYPEDLIEELVIDSDYLFDRCKEN